MKSSHSRNKTYLLRKSVCLPKSLPQFEYADKSLYCQVCLQYLGTNITWGDLWATSVQLIPTAIQQFVASGGYAYYDDHNATAVQLDSGDAASWLFGNISGGSTNPVAVALKDIFDGWYGADMDDASALNMVYVFANPGAALASDERYRGTDGNDRIAMILMDYANRVRLKILGRVEFSEGAAAAAGLSPEVHDVLGAKVVAGSIQATESLGRVEFEWPW